MQIVRISLLSVSFTTRHKCTQGWPCLPIKIFDLAQLKKKNELSHFNARVEVNMVLLKRLLACHALPLGE
jgi:hypothetical protein